jgi:NTE family protein
LSVDTPISGYGLVDTLLMDVESTTMAAKMRTRLNTFSHDEINLLLRSGYARADAPIRAHKLLDNSPIADFTRLPILGAQ